MGEGVTNDVQAAANNIVDAASTIANSVYDLGEAEAKRVVSVLVSAIDAAVAALKSLTDKTVG